MDLTTIVKAAAVIQTACAVTLVGIALYCNKKQKEIDAIVLDDRKQFFADALAKTGWQNIQIH